MIGQSVDFVLNQGAPTLLILSIPATAIGEFGLIVPILLESILLIAGYKIAHGDYTFFSVTIFTLIGSLVGSTALYFLSRILGDKVLSRYKYFAKKRKEIEAKLEKYAGWEPIGIGILRLTPGLMIPTTIGAGILEIPFWKFATGVVISSLVYNVVFISLGFILGLKSPLLAANVLIALKIAAFSLVVLAFFLLWKIFVKGKASKS